MVLRLAALALALASLTASPAAALDLTGTWQGKYTCTEYDGTRSKFTVKDDVLLISQVADVLAVDSENPFTGVPIADEDFPETRGEAKLARCTTDNVVSNGGDEVARLQVKIDRVKGKGKLKAVSIYTFPGGVGSCSWSYKLVDPADPGAAGCPN